MANSGIWNIPASKVPEVGSSVRKTKTLRIHTKIAAGMVINSGCLFNNDFILFEVTIIHL